MNAAKPALAFALITIIAGCASRPVGPSVMVMPTPGKPFDIFRQEEAECRSYAQASVGITANDAAAKSVAETAAVGTVIGATAGALSGGHGGAVGSGAAVGLLGGAAIGSDIGNQASYEVQRRYDIAYQQCMYAKGNQVRGYPSYRRPAYNNPPVYNPQGAAPTRPAPGAAPPPPPPPPSQYPSPYER